MEVGQVWKDKVYTYQDPISGRMVTRLTDYRGHSNSLYFTDNFWVKENKSFMFTSDREGYANLFLYDLKSHIITQLTAFQGQHRPAGLYSAVNAAHYFWYGRILYEINVATFKLRQLYEETDSSFEVGNVSITADGKYACFRLQKKLAEEKQDTLEYSKSPQYLELFKSKPYYKILKLDLASGKSEVVHDGHYHVQHINTSPTQPHLLTFCHEGPWARIDQRIWGLNLSTGEVWKIRPQHGDIGIGHEYWFKDGERIGYHGRRLPEEKMHVWGSIKWDNTELIEYDFPYHCAHFQSNDLDLAVGDGTPPNVQPWFPSNAKPYLMLIKREGDTFTGPRILALHRSSFNDQYAHPHATITPAGTHVLYTSDVTGYANIYLVEIGNFYTLPEVTPNSLLDWKKDEPS